MGCGCNHTYSYPGQSLPEPDPDPDPDPVAVCPAGQMPSRAGGCLQPMQCAPGEVWDEASQECVPEKGGGCAAGEVWDALLQKCLLSCPVGESQGLGVDGVMVCLPNQGGGDSGNELCRPGFHKEGGECVKDVVCLPGQKRGADGECLSGQCDTPLYWSTQLDVCMNPDGTEYDGTTVKCPEWEDYDAMERICRKKQCKPGQIDLGGEKSLDCRWPPCPAGQFRRDGACVYPSEVTNTNPDPLCPAGKQRSTLDGLCHDRDWVRWAEERPIPDDGWIRGTDTGVRICNETNPLFSGYAVSMDGMRIRFPNGDVVDEAKVCEEIGKPASYPCTYTSDENLLVFGILDVSTILQWVGLPPLPSLDQSICDYQKEDILDDIISVIDAEARSISLADLDAAFNDPSSGLEYTATSLGGSLADYVTAAIQFGRGEFGESVLNMLGAIPGVGNVLEGGLESLGVGTILREFLNDKLTVDQKGTIIDFTVDALSFASVAAAAFPIAIPILALIKSMILFGQRKWDEAVMEILTLGMGKIFDKVGKAWKAWNTLPPGVPPPPPGVLAKGMEAVKNALIKALNPFIKILNTKLIPFAQARGWLDAAGNLTAEGETVIEAANLTVSAASATYDLVNGYEPP